jgi:hypothetical protein
MSESRGESDVCSVGLPGAQDGVQDVDSSAGQGDEGLVVSFAFGAFAVVEGAAGRVALQGAERSSISSWIAAGSLATLWLASSLPVSV